MDRENDRITQLQVALQDRNLRRIQYSTIEYNPGGGTSPEGRNPWRECREPGPMWSHAGDQLKRAGNHQAHNQAEQPTYPFSNSGE